MSLNNTNTDSPDNDYVSPSDEQYIESPSASSLSSARNSGESDSDFSSDEETSTDSASPYPPLPADSDEADRSRGTLTRSPPKPKSYPNRRKQKKTRRKAASSMRYDRKKEKDLFPPTKKYRYYPVTCEFCRQRMQPTELKAHQQKYHFGETEDMYGRRVQSVATRKVQTPENKSRRTKSAGGIPRRFQFCYICGGMYGSKSIKIHEPQCLEKWKIQNESLPPELRAPEPQKPESASPVNTGKKDYDIPNFDSSAEAAFQHHLENLIPCSYCSRTFSPDRIQKHMSCCIERPKSRQYESPKGGEIKR